MKTNSKRIFNSLIRPISTSDLQLIKSLIAPWQHPTSSQSGVKFNNTNEIINNITNSIKGKNQQKYYVAISDEGLLIGVMGMSKTEGEIRKPFINSKKSVEVRYAFTLPDSGFSGVGQALFNKIEEEARSSGAKEIIVSSNQKFKERGWPFWTKNFGEPVHVYRDYWKQPDTDVAVWRKNI